MSPDEVCQLAQNLARNCGYACFPVRLITIDGEAKKVPARPKREGGRGYLDATKDPDEIAFLWQRWPGELIGVATGAASGTSVLDVDQKRPEAVAWWQDSHVRLLPTRTVRSRSGGLHLWFQHRDGVKNSQGRIARGVDTRGEGGFIVHWYAAGFKCLDHSPPAPWPTWLMADLMTVGAPKPLTPRPSQTCGDDSSAIDGIQRALGRAREGERNSVLFWCACRLDERHLRQSEIEALLGPIAVGIGLTDFEIRRTIGSAIGRAAA